MCNVRCLQRLYCILFNARSGVRWEDFFHIARMLEVDLKLPNIHFRTETA